ncbi:MAG: hypothetical protein EBU66_05510 [Bacteroidetes bacterium]|nr:hypothetical protein [bacterium]NBP64119.1 hypothetical protein [Bacteroidota bacterium]
MEPHWMQVISNATVCNWFYIFFLVYAALIIMLVVSILITLTNKAARQNLTFPYIVGGTVSLIVATTQFLFFYILCDRSLKPQ